VAAPMGWDASHPGSASLVASSVMPTTASVTFSSLPSWLWGGVRHPSFRQGLDSVRKREGSEGKKAVSARALHDDLMLWTVTPRSWGCPQVGGALNATVQGMEFARQ
jgi:hypothetical protein